MRALAAVMYREGRIRATNLRFIFWDVVYPLSYLLVFGVGLRMIAVREVHGAAECIGSGVLNSAGALTPLGEFWRRHPGDELSPRHMFIKRTIRSGSGYGNGFNSTMFTTEKTAVFAAIPSASVRTAARENPGDFHKLRIV